MEAKYTRRNNTDVETHMIVSEKCRWLYRLHFEGLLGNNDFL